jgi:hypothetical protein
VAVAKIREAQQSGALQEIDVTAPMSASGLRVTAMRIPETAEGAEMISGDEMAAADRIAELIRQAR